MHQHTSLEATVAGFADNFVSAHITVVTGDFQQVNTQKLCETKSDGTPVCVTGDQLAALLAGGSGANQSPAAAQPGPGGTSTFPGSVTQNGAASTTPGTPPTVQINGNNPAIIHIGDTYADLGTTITGSQSDLDLGIKTFLNGKLVSNIIIDSSAVARNGHHRLGRRRRRGPHRHLHPNCRHRARSHSCAGSFPIGGQRSLLNRSHEQRAVEPRRTP
jgi:hypothetical protein